MLDLVSYYQIIEVFYSRDEDLQETVNLSLQVDLETTLGDQKKSRISEGLIACHRKAKG